MGITVITPTIPGREEFLEDCVRSVQAQTVPVQHLIGLDADFEGPAKMRNELVSQATTEYVLFLDDDDLLDIDYVEHVTPFLDEYDVVYTWCRKNFDYPTSLPFDGPALRERNVIPVTACVRRSSFTGVGGFPDDVAYEDWALWLNLLDAGASFYCTETVMWTYIRSDDGRDAKNRGEIASGRLKPL